jgi:hypothetical protein
MDNWDTHLTFVIAPKSGPLRKMVKLHDVQQALIADLPPGYLKRAHWLRAGQALVTAAETGKPRDIECAFDAIVAALDEEGWLPQGASLVPHSEPPRFFESPRSEPPRFEPPRFEPPRFEPPRFEPRRFEPPRSEPPHSEPRRFFESPRSEPPRSEPPRFFEPRRFEPPRCNITPRRPAEPLWRRIHPAGTNRQTAEGEQRASASFTRGPKDLEQFVREYLLFL